MDAHLIDISGKATNPSSVSVSVAGSRVAIAPPSDQRTRKRTMQPVNRCCRPPAHPTKWTVVVDRPREARALTLFDTQAEVHAEIIRLRERGVAHVFALAPLAACGDRPTVAALRDPTDMGENEAVGPGSPRSRWRDGHSFRRARPCNERRLPF
jgi:hypothetical protein